MKMEEKICILEEKSKRTVFESYVSSDEKLKGIILEPTKPNVVKTEIKEEFDEDANIRVNIEEDFATELVYQCTWPGCYTRRSTCSSIEEHVRDAHLGPRNGEDHEEEFYYTELEVGLTAPLPTLSHRDMARPAHEDPEYLKALGTGHGPISIPSNTWKVSTPISMSCSIQQINMSISAPSKVAPTRRPRRETQKCRKVYGVDFKNMWCTQCKWKKACTRFTPENLQISAQQFLNSCDASS